jgi:hypothetical protein
MVKRGQTWSEMVNFKFLTTFGKIADKSSSGKIKHAKTVDNDDVGCWCFVFWSFVVEIKACNSKNIHRRSDVRYLICLGFLAQRSHNCFSQV